MQMSPDLKKLINLLLKKQGGMLMLFFFQGKVYVLRDHWRYLDPENAPKILLGKAFSPMSTITLHPRDSNRVRGAKVLYLTEEWK